MYPGRGSSSAASRAASHFVPLSNLADLQPARARYQAIIRRVMPTSTITASYFASGIMTSCGRSTFGNASIVVVVWVLAPPLEGRWKSVLPCL